MRQRIGAAEDGIGLRCLGAQGVQGIAATAGLGDGFREDDLRGNRGTGFRSGAGEAQGAAGGAAVVGAQDGRAPVAAGGQVAEGGAARVFLREADHHVQRMGLVVPEFDHGHVGIDQQAPRAGRVLGAGEHDAVRAAAEHGGQPGFLMLRVIAGDAQRGFIALRGQGVDERIEHVGKQRVPHRRHDGRHQPRLARGQPARQGVGHVARLLHGLRHAQPRGLGHQFRPVQRARGGDGRHAGNAGQVLERGRIGVAQGAEGHARPLPGMAMERRLEDDCVVMLTMMSISTV